MAIAARIIPIGNSQGIRIPKPLLEQSGLGEEVEIEVRVNEIVIRAARRPRSGWDDAFTTMAARGDDAPVDDGWPAPSAWDDEEWQWET